jgi:hypothetical protein
MAIVIRADLRGAQGSYSGLKGFVDPSQRSLGNPRRNVRIRWHELVFTVS